MRILPEFFSLILANWLFRVIHRAPRSGGGGGLVFCFWAICAWVKPFCPGEVDMVVWTFLTRW
ncbi:MAG: hypothetical protein DWH82_00360 [Planctomycetota bacterium]|nr:MAG: hypothetical protein DWH82_00360 [Planctomycetota bacterium]